jgi:serine/threonine protein kinase
MYPDTSTALPAGQKVDQYVVGSVLGRGGFGITYAVRDPILEKDFALKEFFPEGLVYREDKDIKIQSEIDFQWGLKRFYDEARLLAQFNHPNIVTVKRVFQANSTAYILLDFIEGRTLETWLLGLDSPPTQEELDIITFPLLSALAFVHVKDIRHLDIAPDNIMIRASDGEPILLDFGAARLAIKQHSQLVSATIFKPGYAAPEQYTPNIKHYGPWTDIYGLAATLYRSISGKRPVDAPARRIRDELAPAAKVAKGNYRHQFLSALDWALDLQPDRRPQTIDQWHEALFEGSGRKSVHMEVKFHPPESDRHQSSHSQRLQFQPLKPRTDRVEPKQAPDAPVLPANVQVPSNGSSLPHGPPPLPVNSNPADPPLKTQWSNRRWLAPIAMLFILLCTTYAGFELGATTQKRKTTNALLQARQQAIDQLKQMHAQQIESLKESHKNELNKVTTGSSKALHELQEELAITKQRIEESAEQVDLKRGLREANNRDIEQTKQRNREPTTTLANLTQIMCVGVLKHVRKDTKGHGWGDHLAREAAPEVER